MHRLLIALLIFALLGPVWAQPDDNAPGDTILVFDASGSMWGQIDGINKIVTAREVVADLMDDLPANRRMGLMAYGHNRKGDCEDIEMLVPVGTDRDAIRQAVNDINPKGMTPMTDAVIKAAEMLKYTEHEATVILVSDGEETCHANPCDAAEKLNDLGVNLTVHTVGFGLPEAEAGNAEVQLQCLAENTGGQSFMAENAAQLSDALEQVVEAEPEPTPEPETIEVTFKATDQEGGPVIEHGLIWIVRDGGSGDIVYESDGPEGVLETDLEKGIKDVSVVRVEDEAGADGEINPANKTDLVLPIVMEYNASIDAPEAATAGSTIRVSWTGPEQQGDYIAIAKPDDNPRWPAESTRVSEGSPLGVQVPSEPGEYNVLYVLKHGYKAVAEQPITVTAAEAEV